MLRDKVIIEKVRSCSGMYFKEVNYYVVAAFVLGYDVGLNGEPLRGFDDWLSKKLGFGANLSWQSLIIKVAFPDSVSPEAGLEESEGQQRAIDCLFDNLLEFFGRRSLDAQGALPKIR